MDTTKEYIDMCMALPDEMRAAWDPHAGDFVFAKHGFSDYDFRKESDNGVLGIITEVQEGTFSIKPCGEDGAVAWYSVEHSIPLWRQDQLQDMLSDSIREILFYNQIILDCWDSNSDKHMTMEQLWLWLVMDKKYGKRWKSEQKRWV